MGTGYIAVDFGTTHMKAGLFGPDGALLAMEKIPTPTVSDGTGPVYDPAGVRRALLDLLRPLTEAGAAVGGIAVTGMAEAGVMLDRDGGTCLSPILPWFDPRTRDLAAREEGQSRARFFATGLRNSYKYGIYKYRWLLEQTGAAPERTVWLSAADYLVYLLTGAAVTDPTYAARTYAFDLASGRFDGAYLSRSGLRRENFPAVIPSGGFAGPCRVPRLEGVPVHIAAHDHVCAAYAMAQLDSGAVCNSCGTAETYLGVLPRRALTEADYETGFVFGPYPGGDRMFWMANISSSGMAVEWYRRRLQQTPLSYEELDRLLAREDGPTGILFVPALTGVGTPCFSQDMAAAFLGLRERHTGAQLLKAVVEGLGYQGRMILEPVRTAGVLSVGGATESAPWMQAKADILGCDVTTLAEKEATAMGAVALMLACQQGTEAAARFSAGMKRGTVYRCRPAVHGAYSPHYQAYRRWFRLLRDAAEAGK